MDKAVAFAADNDKTDKHLLAAVIAEKVNPDKQNPCSRDLRSP